MSVEIFVNMLVQRDQRLFCYQQVHTAGISLHDGQISRAQWQSDSIRSAESIGLPNRLFPAPVFTWNSTVLSDNWQMCTPIIGCLPLHSSTPDNLLVPTRTITCGPRSFVRDRGRVWCLWMPCLSFLDIHSRDTQQWLPDAPTADQCSRRQRSSSSRPSSRTSAARGSKPHTLPRHHQFVHMQSAHEK